MLQLYSLWPTSYLCYLNKYLGKKFPKQNYNKLLWRHVAQTNKNKQKRYIRRPRCSSTNAVTTYCGRHWTRPPLQLRVHTQNWSNISTIVHTNYSMSSSQQKKSKRKETQDNQLWLRTQFPFPRPLRVTLSHSLALISHSLHVIQTALPILSLCMLSK